jgi:hypothetical protein
MVLNAILSKAADTCGEFWFNRYQSALAGFAALAGAIITVRAMMGQTDMTRADDVERRLARYAGAILNVMQAYAFARPLDDEEDLEIGTLQQKRLDVATDAPSIREAMIDGALGPDTKMVAQFISACRFAAAGKIYDRPDVRHSNLVWPLYVALTNGIIRRQNMLRSGVRVSDLYSFSTIDHAEVDAAFIEQRAPIIT